MAKQEDVYKRQGKHPRKCSLAYSLRPACMAPPASALQRPRPPVQGTRGTPFQMQGEKRVDKMLNALRLKSTVLGLELGSTRIKAVF